jgi:hypothetical protein
MFTVTPFFRTKRRPPYPDWREVSLVIISQEGGSGVPCGQTLAKSVVLSTRKRSVYDVPADAVYGLIASRVDAPATLLLRMRYVPSREALYQLFASFQCNSTPKLL